MAGAAYGSYGPNARTTSPIPIQGFRPQTAGPPRATMTQAQQTISIALLLSSIYLVLQLGLVPLPDVVSEQIVPVLPLWLLVSFGAAMLARLGWGVLTFNDTPEAYKELMGEIEQAKTELREKGITVD